MTAAFVEGIGARLLARAREWGARSGSHHVELDTGCARVDAQRFYARQGEAQLVRASGHGTAGT